MSPGFLKDFIVQDFTPNPMGSQFPIPALGSLCSESEVQKFVL